MSGRTLHWNCVGYLGSWIAQVHFVSNRIGLYTGHMYTTMAQDGPGPLWKILVWLHTIHVNTMMHPRQHCPSLEQHKLASTMYKCMPRWKQDDLNPSWVASDAAHSIYHETMVQTTLDPSPVGIHTFGPTTDTMPPPWTRAALFQLGLQVMRLHAGYGSTTLAHGAKHTTTFVHHVKPTMDCQHCSMHT